MYECEFIIVVDKYLILGLRSSVVKVIFMMKLVVGICFLETVELLLSLPGRKERKGEGVG